MYVIISLKKGPKQNRINRLMSSMPEGGDIYTLFRNCKLIHANFMLKIKFLIQFDTSVAQKTNQVYMTLRVGTKRLVVIIKSILTLLNLKPLDLQTNFPYAYPEY